MPIDITGITSLDGCVPLHSLTIDKSSRLDPALARCQTLVLRHPPAGDSAFLKSLCASSHYIRFKSARAKFNYHLPRVFGSANNEGFLGTLRCLGVKDNYNAVYSTCLLDR